MEPGYWASRQANRQGKQATRQPGDLLVRTLGWHADQTASLFSVVQKGTMQDSLCRVCGPLGNSLHDPPMVESGRGGSGFPNAPFGATRTPPHPNPQHLYVHIYIYICIHMHTICVYIYIYT